MNGVPVDPETSDVEVEGVGSSPFISDVMTEPFFTALDTPSPSARSTRVACFYGDSKAR
ncbi:hypothetical protein [Williamsia muralis]|uniref:Uncharacterized protein n=1 Tax=Williamsia marianensis TaxID=85044 RepID=A0ABU4EMT6_WILMA|nr:hypothetical protein [Williamsia muralis]MDV7132548.1 hypothetical protein [Williamsia muralis]